MGRWRGRWRGEGKGGPEVAAGPRAVARGVRQACGGGGVSGIIQDVSQSCCSSSMTNVGCFWLALGRRGEWKGKWKEGEMGL